MATLVAMSINYFCLQQTNIRNDDKGGDDDDGAENDVGDDSTEYKHKRD